MARSGQLRGAGGPAGWPVFLLLALTVVVPSVGLLWFMARTVENERLAVRQRLADAYRAQLGAVRTRLESGWASRLERIREMCGDGRPAERFAAIARSGLADAAIMLGDHGVPAYPMVKRRAGAAPLAAITRDPGWTRARALEFAEKKPGAAAVAYADLARASSATHAAAYALLAQARCLAKAGDTAAASAVLIERLLHPRYRDAQDPTGRLLAPAAMLRILELTPAAAADPAEIVRGLTDRINDYGRPELPSSQRRFLATSLLARSRSVAEAERAVPGSVFPTLEAERLAADYLDAHGRAEAPTLVGPWSAGARDGAGPSFAGTRVADLWQLTLPDSGVVLLCSRARLEREAVALAGELSLPPGVSLSLAPPGAPEPDPRAALTRAAGRPCAGWQLVLARADGPLLDESAAADAAVFLYLWMGALFIAVIVTLVLLVTQLIRRQLRVARLRNDLVATVTHELKTPLASIRLLVDTLLEQHPADPTRTRDYLELVARENQRLGRLIDGFLAFSRMERGKTAFNLAPVNVAAVVEESLRALAERIENDGFSVTREIADDLPEIHGDAGALVTVVINLLDNALKYSDDDRRIVVRAREDREHVLLEVEDHGIGMSAADARRAFRRFYQADRTLTRQAGGCGLGLSIVRFVVEAHAGAVSVESRLGAGSTFTIRVPRADSKETATR